MTEFTPAGRLIHTVLIERITGRQQTATGETVDVWTAAEEVPAEVKPLRGRNVEIAAARSKGRVLSHQITMRWVPDVNPATTRFRFGGRTFEIFQAVNVMERDVELDCLCDEVVA